MADTTSCPDTTRTPSDTGRRTFLGQPRVLANLFGVELWERFSFYGHVALSVVPGVAGVGVGAVLAFGSGGVKAKATALVGTLYADGDTRRDAGFSIFYLGTVYSDKQLDRDLFGFTMPVSWVQSINPVFIIVLSGLFAALWTRLGLRQPATPLKFAMGTVIMGVAFLVFIPVASTVPNSAPLLGLVGILLVFTVAELLLSPVGLSLSTKLAPEVFRTQMVALFFLSVVLGTAMSGTLAGNYSDDAQVPYFGVLGGVAIVIGLALAAASKPILRLMEGVR